MLMSKFKIIVLLVCASFTLSACATNFKSLDESYADKNVKADVIQNEKNIRVTYGTMAPGGGGGLVGILVASAVSAAVTYNNAMNAKDTMAAIEDEINAMPYDSIVKQSALRTMRESGWIDVANKKTLNTVKDASQLFEDTSQDYIIRLNHHFVVPNEDTIQGHLHFALYDRMAENKDEPIYKFSILEIYNVPGSGLFDGDQDGDLRSGDKLLTEGVKSLVSKMHEKMAVYLNDPTNKKIQSVVNQTH